MMKNLSRLSKITLSLTTAALMLFALPCTSQAQAPAPAPAPQADTKTGGIQGHANNPLMQPVPNTTVKLTTDTNSDDTARKYQYSFSVGPDGNYAGTGVKPDEYTVFLIDNKTGKPLDYIRNVSVKSGATVTTNIDMSRKEYMDKMSPEDKARMEEYKKASAATMATNAKITNLNAMLAKARADIQAGNPDPAVTAMQSATQAKPDEPILWITLGQAEQTAGDVAYSNAKKAGTSTSDPAILQKYDSAITAFQKGIDLNLAKKTPDASNLGVSYNQIGQIDGKLGKSTEAIAAYDSAAKALPANAGTYYYNEAATFLNTGKSDEAAAAADKAIAVDPTHAESFYVKGQALIQKASVDPKTQKIVAPPGCVEAYQEYLALAPTGAHAAEVKEILGGIGASVTSTYKAPAKKK